jgi:hypothetical protein
LYIATRSATLVIGHQHAQAVRRFQGDFSEKRPSFAATTHSFRNACRIVLPEGDIELRRVRITNRSWARKVIDVTSYAEVVLAPAAADAMHPAFSNLFVQTEIVHERRAILCTRRPRSLEEKAPWMFHVLAAHGAKIEAVSYETDRMRFIGRGNTVVAPKALSKTGLLSGTDGSVLDPIVAIQCQITLDPEQSVTIDMVFGVGDTREAALSLVEKYQDRRLADRVFELAWTHGQVVLRQINATETDAQLYARLASSVIYANASLRADAAILIRNRRGQSGLWGYAISGDLPIVLLQIGTRTYRTGAPARTSPCVLAIEGLAVDLVIWSEDHAGYRQQLQEQIMGLIAAGTGRASSIGRAESSCGPQTKYRTKTGSCFSRSRARSSRMAAGRLRNRSIVVPRWKSGFRGLCRPERIALRPGCPGRYRNAI